MAEKKQGPSPPGDKDQLRELQAFAERVDGMFPGDEVCHTLDELVIDVKLAEAQAINDVGYDRQLEFLVAAGKGDQARKLLEGLCDGTTTPDGGEEEEEDDD